MLVEEAQWLNSVLHDLRPKQGWIVLDVGSSTEYFRRMGQPYIDYYVFLPLRKAGATVVHIDAKRDEGVDIVCDIADENSRPVVNVIPAADVVICANLLEHVRDRHLVADRLVRLTKEGGYLIVTVPHVYRYHADPIDTMYRPTNAELEALFAGYGFQAMSSTILDVACGYVTVPTSPLQCAAFHVRRIVKRVILNQLVESGRCKVAAIALRRESEN